MRKIEIVNRIADGTGLTKVKAEEAVVAILEEIKDGLQRGEPVIFGSFQVREKGACPGRNPKTGEEAESPAHRVVRFKSGNILRSQSTFVVRSKMAQWERRRTEPPYRPSGNERVTSGKVMCKRLIKQGARSHLAVCGMWNQSFDLNASNHELSILSARQASF